MPSIDESLLGRPPLAADLAAGVDAISRYQTITFKRYLRVVLPLDGYVFWVKADLLSPSAALNASSFNLAMLGAPPQVRVPATTIVAPGSLHYATETRMSEDEILGVNSVIFTSEVPIQDLDLVGPLMMYIGEFRGLRFAFSRRQSFYQQAGLYHYVGDAIYPALSAQIIDSVKGFDSENVVVSNSLPIWLSINSQLPVFPSFATPDNIRPPYATIHIEPSGTEVLQPVPYLDRNKSHWQLTRDRVRVTMYGLRNVTAMDYVDSVIGYMTTSDVMGMMSMGAVRDEKRVQVEILALAMKKVVDFEVSYYQARVNDVARQLILNAIPKFVIEGYEIKEAPVTFGFSYNFAQKRNSFYLASV